MSGGVSNFCGSIQCHLNNQPAPYFTQDKYRIKLKITNKSCLIFKRLTNFLFSYQGDDVAMYIFLPDDIDGLEAMENDLDAERINDVIGQVYQNEVNVTMPKFKITHMLSLKSYLTELGKLINIVIFKSSFS